MRCVHVGVYGGIHQFASGLVGSIVAGYPAMRAAGPTGVGIQFWASEPGLNGDGIEMRANG